MARLTRRNLLAKTSTGMAAAGAFSMSPGLFKVRGGAPNSVSAKPSGARTAADSAIGASAVVTPKVSGKVTPSVVYIRDAAKGEVVFMVGTAQIVRTDRDLVEAISRSASQYA